MGTKPTIANIPTTPQDIKYIYIPITQKMNKIYDDVLKNILFEYNITPKGIYLKTYNEKKFNITNINITDKTYNFTYKDKKNSEIIINLPLYDLIKNEKIISTSDLQLFYTNYNYSDTKISNSPSINIFIQSEYNDYILLEQLKKKIKLNQPIYIEDFIITINNPNYIQTLNINNICSNINNLFLPSVPNIFDLEIDYFYANEKSKEIIYKENKRKIESLRLIAIILYIARIYSETNINYFKGYSNIKIQFNLFKNIDNFKTVEFEKLEKSIENLKGSDALFI